MAKQKRRIVIASRNEDKIRELSEICAGLPFEVASSLDYPDLPEVIEDGTTVRGNAARKAIVTAAYTGEISIADDTALQVCALNDLPDIFASRFAGPGASYADNAALLVDLMRDVPNGQRQARFITSTVWIDPQPGQSKLDRFEPPLQAEWRWLHHPFARAIHVRRAEDEARFWNQFADRRQVWRAYRAAREAALVTHGADKERLRSIIAELLAPFEDGGRPAGAPEGAIQLPDTRIWTASSLDDTEPTTLVTPHGLPADAPGRATTGPVWLEIAAEGRLLGEVPREPLGRQGFGYDPVFRVDGDRRTLAEYAPDEKNAISHRGRALRRLIDAVRGVYGVEA